jgi:hypothetical protein
MHSAPSGSVTASPAVVISIAVLRQGADHTVERGNPADAGAFVQVNSPSARYFFRSK